MESEPMLTPSEKSRKILPRGGSNPQCCIRQDREPNTLPTSCYDSIFTVLKLEHFQIRAEQEQLQKWVCRFVLYLTGNCNVRKLVNVRIFLNSTSHTCFHHKLPFFWNAVNSTKTHTHTLCKISKRKTMFLLSNIFTSVNRAMTPRARFVPDSILKYVPCFPHLSNTLK